MKVPTTTSYGSVTIEHLSMSISAASGSLSVFSIRGTESTGGRCRNNAQRTKAVSGRILLTSHHHCSHGDPRCPVFTSACASERFPEIVGQRHPELALVHEEQEVERCSYRDSHSCTVSSVGSALSPGTSGAGHFLAKGLPSELGHADELSLGDCLSNLAVELRCDLHVDVLAGRRRGGSASNCLGSLLCRQYIHPKPIWSRRLIFVCVVPLRTSHGGVGEEVDWPANLTVQGGDGDGPASPPDGVSTGAAGDRELRG